MLSTVQQTLAVLSFLVVGASCQVTSAWNSRFIGYYIAPDSIEPLLAGDAWITSGTYAGDCNTSGRCALATKCSDNKLYLDDGSVWPCSGEVSCVQATIYATSPAGLPSAINYGCRMNWKAYTIYRELPATTTSLSTLTSATPTPALSVTPTEVVPTPTLVASPTLQFGVSTSSIAVMEATPNSASSMEATPNPSPEFRSRPEPERQNKAWIAGAVIGSVIGIALLIVAIYLWRSRGRVRRMDKAGVELDGETNSYSHLQQYHEKDTEGQLVELSSARYPVELPSSRHPVELEANGPR
ncbi:hypothetical protein COCC4DRAFT_182800 [Bipolaris maydis ATCC 48331]|uniref:Mid2 domain-containing protein n=2 Tax=Cochliobolus heterostrophus TaxID=5016 RepID=M2TD95_COCH5|nr:uncharacterized protein COCC4DRAFT_182800 [Bipolaris maydis ATCC 48331]EMD95445.1 hypothetical protein COCHEDRAFT_1190704 [Bipolaris maydis C5]KAH7561415.1 hypothetical protein BM1_02519 [Bipolaris maydis]ENI10308.1 hypothetical protein COCC4DRAFT_182800 [Bipolaris maydis ATCC 48331]KAJ5030215.1 hypothetical protein J3E73DRAFT_420377 [Bipolaris maydis]KAJ5065217.1 hypothetical protein J3E74DRAFT_300395 [Bipolaris maydis]